MRPHFGLTLFLFIIVSLQHEAAAETKHYIVYMGEHSQPNSESVIKANNEMLASVTNSFHEENNVAIHHYTRSFRGFSAMLTEEQAQQLAERESVVSVFESKINDLHTTRSWKFLGLNSVQSRFRVPSSISNVIVGVMDTGVWPDSESFNDKHLGPIPSKFKGECVVGQNFTSSDCNRKIIGSRFYVKGFEAQKGPLESFSGPVFRSARDSEGHGSHTASIIAGSVVPNANLFGVANGTARGGAPNARLAIYKVCWYLYCADADVLAAMDDAISDGVDILSLSLGPPPPQPFYFQNAISIGAFHAFRKGIFVTCSAGNSYFTGTATNVAPWIMTVAASSIDREFLSNVHLGNLKVLKGFSINPLKMKTPKPLIAASEAASPGVSADNASLCQNNTLDATKIKGKIVVCKIGDLSENRRQKAYFVQQGGGDGIILIDPTGKDIGYQFVIPGTTIGLEEASELQEYMKKEKKPIARISPTKAFLNHKPAPEMAMFSSQGPNVVSPDIIKPDITAPGAYILAAWSPVSTYSLTSVDYYIQSGTSMACPHVSAVAAILKAHYPFWSPAVIKSAIMTTATVTDNTHQLIQKNPLGTPATPFDYGSGHINPIPALNPGLVYDINVEDLLIFLCSIGATPAKLRSFAGYQFSCKQPVAKSYDLNYPSIGISNLHGSVSVNRTVTYYGIGPTVYNASLHCPPGVACTVTPAKLKFANTGEKMAFRIEFRPFKTSNGEFVFGYLTWKNGIHTVRSPIALNVASS
ncbi:hypothetical protein K2173_013880 [Erythroxylum novogranatense]|uniref:Uncharacterized protein n=1 Tax=Erythroxylum novogranatense TaxID=1862640 RepID=A0AAV8SCQ3_9ROSI|nr:hypothetical protein K2173_013880 [Erythroxylum novogranatense]